MGYRGMIDLARRSPYGERGLKYHLTTIAQSANRRSPYGERGLKYRRDIPVQRGCESLSLRRAWIEIVGFIGNCWELRVALLTESVD